METNLKNDETIIEIAKTKGKLEAVKICKLLYGVNLKDAKDHVDEITKGLDIPKPKISRKGCVITIIFIAFIGLMVNLCNEDNNKSNTTNKNSSLALDTLDHSKKINEDSVAKLYMITQKKWEKTKAGKIYLKHPDWFKEDCEKIARGEIWIGMSIDMLYYERGKANRRNDSNYGNGVNYQYCWDDYNPSCFYCGTDGIITSYN